MASVSHGRFAGPSSRRPLALVSGASGVIGFHLARRCALERFDLLFAADDPQVLVDAGHLSRLGVQVTALKADLSTVVGMDELLAATVGRPVDALLVDTGPGLGHAFLNKAFDDVARVVNTNVLGTLHLLHQVAGGMRERGRGRILVTSPIAHVMPGSFQSVYKGSKAFIDSFSWALRRELQGTGVTLTCLLPGPTEAVFHQARAADPATMARVGVQAMMAGEGPVVTGWESRLQAAMAEVAPVTMLAERPRKVSEQLQPH